MCDYDFLLCARFRVFLIFFFLGTLSIPPSYALLIVIAFLFDRTKNYLYLCTYIYNAVSLQMRLKTLIALDIKRSKQAFAAFLTVCITTVVWCEQLFYLRSSRNLRLLDPPFWRCQFVIYDFVCEKLSN